MNKLRLISVCLAMLPALSACDSFGDVGVMSIRAGTFDWCGKANIGDLVDNFFSEPKWKVIDGLDGNRYVNLTGGISYNDSPAGALVQFSYPDSDERFEITAFEINGQGQNVLMIGELVGKMCEEY